jgi:hypothetical protein
MILNSDFSLNKYGIFVRLVEEKDADFILELRLDSELDTYMHQVSSDRIVQVNWIREYKKREITGLEYYFIYFVDGVPIGVNRMINIRNDSWMGASLIFKKDCPPGSPVLATLIQYYIGFEILEKSVHFGDQLKGNLKAMRFNQFLGSDFIYEDENVFFILLSKKIYLQTKEKVEKLFLKNNTN